MCPIWLGTTDSKPCIVLIFSSAMEELRPGLVQLIEHSYGHILCAQAQTHSLVTLYKKTSIYQIFRRMQRGQMCKNFLTKCCWQQWECILLVQTNCCEHFQYRIHGIWKKNMNEFSITCIYTWKWQRAIIFTKVTMCFVSQANDEMHCNAVLEKISSCTYCTPRATYLLWFHCRKPEAPI